MFNRSFLTDSIVNTLLKKEFEVLVTHGCFDIVASQKKEQRKEQRTAKMTMLIKALTNVDSLHPGQAKSLRTISYFISAYPFIVSLRTNRNFLTNDTIYSRFDVPVVTPKMFESIIEDDAYSSKSAKGRHTVEINADELRARRYEMKFTLEGLATVVGVSKKALYEIESKRTNPTEKTARKIEAALRTKLRRIYSPEPAEQARMNPANQLQKKVSDELLRIGVDNSPVQHAPFEIVGKESFSLITGLSSNVKEIKRSAGSVKKLSSIFEADAFFVAKQIKEKSIDGVPILLEDELPEIESVKELRKLIEESSE